jgi:hypothetical protein
LFGSGVVSSLVMPGPVDTPMLENPHWLVRRPWLSYAVIPADWVAWAVVAAVAYGLAEVEVPMGSGTLQKIAALFPDLSSAWYGFGNSLIDLMVSWTEWSDR